MTKYSCHSLGYTREDRVYLSVDLLATARAFERYDTEMNPFGVNYKAQAWSGVMDSDRDLCSLCGASRTTIRQGWLTLTRMISNDR